MFISVCCRRNIINQSLGILTSLWNLRNFNRRNINVLSQLLNNLNTSMPDCLPFFASGEIVHGFGRGSKELGIPTANYPLEVVKSLPESLSTGIYYGWANVDNGEVHKMVMSIGRNPYYDNKEKSMETHIMHEFNRDLYGCLLKVCIVGYLRPEKNFTSLDELIAAIRKDIADANSLLDSNEKNRKLKDSEFFKSSCGQSKVNGTCSKNIDS